MSKDQADGSPCVRAVGYWRMSSSPQEKSVPQQKAEMYPRCKLEGVDLVQEFEDLGISGGSTKRDSFQEMVAFCAARLKAKDPVEAVVCFDTSRFSRADSNETSAAIWQLRQAGVNRVLTWERWWDFRKEEDRAIFNLQQDFTNNRYLRDLSLRVLRGRKDVVLAGFFAGGQIPYGFDRVMIAPDGTPGQRFPKGVKIAVREKGFRMALSPIPEDDPDPDRQQERQTAIWIYETFDRESHSYRSLARILTQREVPGPGARYKRKVPKPSDMRWTVSSVREILRNPVYKGVARVGYTSKGKYHRLVKGEIEAVEVTAVREQSPGNVVLREMEFGGLVDADLWERVQVKAKERSEKKAHPRRNEYVVPPGILHCGHCGGRMHGQTFRPKMSTGKEYRRLVCSANKTRPGLCKDYSVDEGELLSLLVEHVLKPFLARRRSLVEAAVAAEVRKPKEDTREVVRLRKRLADLDADVRQGVRNLRRAKKNQDLLDEALAEVRAERDDVKQHLVEMERLAAGLSYHDWVSAARAVLQEGLWARSDLMGEVLRRVLSRVELRFECKSLGAGKRTRYKLVSVRIKLRVADG